MRLTELVENRKALRIVEPTSAWDIMEWVIQQVKDEPSRLNMATWGGTVDPGLLGNPPCGTVACFSGWANIRMLGKLRGNAAQGAMLAGVESPLIGDEEGCELWKALYHDLFVDDELTSMSPGAITTIAAVEQRAREIMGRFEKRLKRVIIFPDGSYELRPEAPNAPSSV